MNPIAMAASERKPFFSTSQTVQILLLSFALLFPFLNWREALGCVLLMLLFVAYILPKLDVELSEDSDEARRARRGLILYCVSVLVLVLIYRHSLYVVAAAWAIMALGENFASAAGRAIGGPALALNPRKTWAGFFAFVVTGTLVAYALARWGNPSIEPRVAWIVCALAALLGAIVASLPIGLDTKVTVPLVTAAFLFSACLIERSALASNLPYLGRRIILAVAINLGLALAALGLKLVTRSGAAVGFLLGIAVYTGYGYKSFLLLFAFFVLGSVATRLGYAQKAALGIAERRGGARSGRQAAANLLAAAFFSILVITTHHEYAFLVALVATLAEAAGDTVSSEIGEWLAQDTYLITTFQRVAVGENGGVSFAGSAAGVVAAALVVALALALGLVHPGGAAVALGAAIVGNLADSLLGATLERKGLITNGIVNFVATSFAGGVALGLML